MGLLYEAFVKGGSAPVHNVSVAWMHARACGHAWRRTLVGEEAWWHRGMGDDGGAAADGLSLRWARIFSTRGLKSPRINCWFFNVAPCAFFFVPSSALRF